MGVLRKFVKENSNQKYEKGRKSSTSSKTDDDILDDSKMMGSAEESVTASNNKQAFDVGDYICTEKLDCNNFFDQFLETMPFDLFENQH